MFFADYGINSILFQRGIYPPETFVNTQQYGLTILMSKDSKIEEFLRTVLQQTQGKFGALPYWLQISLFLVVMTN